MTEILQQYVSWKGWEERGFGRFDANSKRYYGWHFDRVVAAGTCPRVLEIGFGNGGFLGYCLDRGCSAYGVEIDPALRERASQMGIGVAASVSELRADQQFDLVALFDVLEHIPGEALVGFLTGLVGHLAPAGRVLVRVPNGDSPFGRQFQHGDLTHVTAYGIGKLRQLAQLTGLEIVAVGEAPWNAQQDQTPGVRTFARTAVRKFLDRLFGFAYYRAHIDLDKNLTVVMAFASPPRPAPP